ncbi:MFS transporter [Gemmatimonadetes bacterium T265]|nr:MFS transporter [Gemmatimonadetes bacterium T265]
MPSLASSPPSSPSAAPPSLNPFRTLVRHRNFRLFWFGQTVSLVGTWMQVMAQGWLALELTNNAFLVGLVASVGAFPVLLLSFPAGVLVDRVDRLRLVTAMQAVLLVEAAALWALTLTGRVTVGWLLALACLNGTCTAFEVPARQSLIIDLVGRDDLPEAIALNSSGFNLARIVGPALGAAAIASLGIAWCFALNALSYLAVLAGLLLIRLPRRAASAPAHHSSPWAGLAEGFRYAWHAPAVRAILGLTLVFSVCGTPYMTLMPVFARDVLGLGAGGYGALLAALGVGGLAGALGLAALGRRVRRGPWLMWSTAAYPALLVVLACVRRPAAAEAVLLAAGVAMIVCGALGNAVLQRAVPDALRGRLMAAYSFLVVGMAQGVGALAGGALARAVGVAEVIAAGGVVMLGYAGWVYATVPELKRVK